MWQFIQKYPLKYWPWYLCGVIALISTTYITTLIPLELSQIIDLITENKDWNVLKAHVIKLIGLALILAVARSLSRILIFTPGRYVEYDLRKAIHQHLLILPPNFFRKHKIGDIMSRTINDIQSLRLLSAFGFLHIINTVMIYSLVLTQMIAINPLLTALTLIPVPMAMIMVKFFVKRLHQCNKESQEKLAKLTDFFVESVANISIIKSYNAEAQLLARMQSANQDYKDTQLRLVGIRSIMFPFIASIGAIANIILVIFGTRLVISNQISLGNFVAFTAFLNLLAWPTAAFSWIINIIQRGIVSLNRIQEILQSPAHPQHFAQEKLVLEAAPEITVKNLNFSYPDSDKAVLKNISFCIKAGESLGIFGLTGSGKSSLANILALIESIEAGQVFINGKDVCHINVNSCRDHISKVSQKRFLFSDSITENVAFSDPQHLSAAALDLSAQKACVQQDIQKFPDTWSTMVGEKGIVLSGGQQHRLALARAYAARYHFIILDDVLSSVDHATETAMIQALFDPQSRSTKCIISQRISALEKCDHIIVLDQGCITDEGSHEELLAKKGPYQAAYHYQQLLAL